MKNNSSKLKIVVQGYDSSTIEEAVIKIVKQTIDLDLKFSGPVPLPVKRELITVLRSPHKHDSREQFERRTHKRLIIVFDVNKNHLSSYSHLQIPHSVDVKISA